MPSYSRCATDIVRLGLKPSLRLASCCSVEVVNGAAGDRFWVRVPTFVTIGCRSRMAATCASDVVSSGISIAAPSIRTRSAANVSPAAVARIAWIVQYSRAVNPLISRSRSTTSRTATDWTRPAERPRWTFLASSGLSVYPTRRSTMRRVCWASTRSMSIWRGCAKASLIADSVISLNVTRSVFSGGTWAASATCQAMASPSRSRSVAR